MNLLHLQTGLSYHPRQIVCVVHLRITVGHRREIETGHRQTEGCRLITLTVPECLHDIEAVRLVHDLRRTLQDALYLFFPKAVQELAHPDDVIVTVCGEGVLLIQQVCGIAVDAVCSRLACRLLLHQFQLLGQIHHGYLHIRIIAHAAQGPTARIAAHVEQTTGLLATLGSAALFGGKHHLQCLFERTVGVEMVESEPTLLHLFRQ